MRYTIETAHWRVPSEEHAFDGWLEGSPNPDERATILAEIVRKREVWTPSKEAWSQLHDLERFIGQRVRLQFWDKIMHLPEDEGPYPILSDCHGIVLLRQQGFLQAYLPNSSGYSPAKFLNTEMISGLSLAPIAELFEISSVSCGQPVSSVPSCRAVWEVRCTPIADENCAVLDCLRWAINVRFASRRTAAKFASLFDEAGGVVRDMTEIDRTGEHA
jgi:hypothetical protein